jgi:hypothetical protein
MAKTSEGLIIDFVIWVSHTKTTQNRVAQPPGQSSERGFSSDKKMLGRAEVFTNGSDAMQAWPVSTQVNRTRNLAGAELTAQQGHR